MSAVDQAEVSPVSAEPVKGMRVNGEWILRFRPRCSGYLAPNSALHRQAMAPEQVRFSTPRKPNVIHKAHRSSEGARCRKGQREGDEG
jgi:hypothetical protein